MESLEAYSIICIEDGKIPFHEFIMVFCVNGTTSTKTFDLGILIYP